MTRISRAHDPLPSNPAREVTVAVAVADSETIDFRQYAMIRFRRVSGSVATLTLYESDSPDGPWLPSKVDNTAVTAATGDFWNNLQLDVAGAFYLRFQGDAAGEVKVVLKG